MNLHIKNNQVLSVDQCKELLALGLDMSDSFFIWEYTNGQHLAFVSVNRLTKDEESYFLLCHTYTLQEILEKLPAHLPNKIDAELFVSMTDEKKGYVAYADYTGDGVYYYHEEIGSDLLEAAFNMLKWCIGKKCITM